jgi:hypothetical protein
VNRATVTRLCAVIFAGLTGVVIAFQLAVALGAPWGVFTQGGQALGALSPAGRLVALASAVILALFAIAVLARVGIGPLAAARERLVSVVAWIAVGYSGLAILLNGASRSSQERMVWVPVSVVLFVTSLLAVLETRRPKAK